MRRRQDRRWGERMALRCKGCGSGEHVKNGFMRGKQRYRCEGCGLNFTDTPPRGMPLRVKVEAVLLYLSGLSMNRTAKLLGVSTPSVMAWIERFAEVHARKPEPEGRAVVVELDEMWHFLTSCLVAERYWDQARWAIEAYAWCFEGLERAPRTGG